MGYQCADLHSWMLMLHLKDDSLTSEIMSTMSFFNEPEQIFPLAFSLKEEGNKLVKVGDFEQAFTIYTKAVTFLVLGLPCCVHGSHPFRDLAIPLNLNLAICALKLSKFRLAKCLCDCVLQFEPKNIKALFRRASAALRSGQLMAAKNDLIEAKKVDPNNGDVLREWKRVNLLLHEASGNSVNPTRCVDMVINHKPVASSIGLEAQNLGFNPLNIPTKNQPNHVDQVESERVESVGSNLEEICSDNLVGSKANLSNLFTYPPKVNGELEDTSSFSGSSRPFLNSNLAEPKRFSNQLRPDSILNLPPPDYKRLADGQVLRYHDPRLVGFMSIRVKRFPNKPDSEMREIDSEMQKINSEMQETDFEMQEIEKINSKMQEIDSQKHKIEVSSLAAPEENNNVGDNCTYTQYRHGVIACGIYDIVPSSIKTIDRTLTTVPDSAKIIHKPLNRQKVTSRSGSDASRSIRRHPFVPSFNYGTGKSWSMRSVKRISTTRTHLTPGMKRKCMSNTFISSYPAWKRRVLFNREKPVHPKIDYGHNPLKSSPNNNSIHRVDMDLINPNETIVTNSVMDKLNISLQSQGNFSAV